MLLRLSIVSPILSAAVDAIRSRRLISGGIGESESSRRDPSAARWCSRRHSKGIGRCAASLVSLYPGGRSGVVARRPPAESNFWEWMISIWRARCQRVTKRLVKDDKSIGGLSSLRSYQDLGDHHVRSHKESHGNVSLLGWLSSPKNRLKHLKGSRSRSWPARYQIKSYPPIKDKLWRFRYHTLSTQIV